VAITADTAAVELAALVSQTLEAAGIQATLSGGGAVSPLEFGDRLVHHDDVPRFETPWGPLRVTTPTQCVMDRLAAFWHWRDRQSWDQAVMVAAHQTIDYEELAAYAASEGADSGDVSRLREQAGRQE
jgi:hypothetical protein